MPNYCPFCEKKGMKSKINLLQINMEEAVLLCEVEECTWPFGYKNFQYVSRKVGNMWSYNWNNYSTETKNSFVPVPLELSLYSPPETPFTDTLRDLIELSSDSTNSTSIINNNVSPNNLSIPSISDHDHYCLKSTESENIDIKSENCNIHDQDPDLCETILEDNSKQSWHENAVSVNVDKSDEMKTINNSDITYGTDVLETNFDCYRNLTKEEEKHCNNINSHSLNNTESSNSALNSKTKIKKRAKKNITSHKLKVTKVEVNGLPVTFSYETPILPPISTTVLNTSTNPIKLQNDTTFQAGTSSPTTSINTNSKSPDKKNETVTKSKRHEKFNFNIFKKKSNNDNNDTTTIKNIGNDKDIVADQIQKENSPVNNNMEAKLAKNDVDENIHENMKLEPVKNDVNERVKVELPKNKNIDTNVDLNIDDILNDFLTNISPTKANDINELNGYDEDWIYSLIT
ncbi:hypothetical protein M0802_001729 [Mischocyttarus mexicanus]|nr:hypothetical protein M0802_001729 [Mischocyttarus mexicanus]